MRKEGATFGRSAVNMHPAQTCGRFLHGRGLRRSTRFHARSASGYPNQDVTSQAHQTPDATPTIYVRLSIGGDGIPVWSMDALHSDPNAYNTGKRVHYPGADGPVYESRRDGNTSTPGTDEWWSLVG